MANPDGPRDPDWDRLLRAELNRRILELSTYPDDAFGRIRRGEAFFMACLFVLGPAALVWLFR